MNSRWTPKDGVPFVPKWSAAEQPTNWTRQLTTAQVEEVVGVLSAFPNRLFDPASVS